MTDAFRPDDELVSAVLDGEASSEERARVETDPVLSARLAEFTAIRDQIATSVPTASEADRERAIAAAKIAVRPQAPVVPLRPRRDVPRFLAVAAAVLVVLLGVGLLASRIDRSDYGSEDSASGDAGDDAGGESSVTADDALAESGGDASAAAGPLSGLQDTDLGPVADETELRSAIEEASGTAPEVNDSATTAPSTLPQPVLADEARGSSEDCQVGLIEADPTLSGGVLAQATTTYAGTSAVVYVYGTPDGHQRVVVVSDEACETLAAFDL